MSGQDATMAPVSRGNTTPVTQLHAASAVPGRGASAASGRGVSAASGRGVSAAVGPVLDAAMRAWRRNFLAWIIRAASLLVGVIIWYVATRAKLKFYVDFENIPSPLAVAAALLTHLHQTRFFIDIGVSLARIAVSYGLAVVVGIPVGVLVGRIPLARNVISPWIEVLRPIPAVAWIPLAILLWPTEESSIVFITFLGALFPIVLNTATGAEHTPELLLRAARSLGAPPRQIFRHVIIPAALPSIGAGLAVGMGVSWFSLLAGEIISGQYGIGYFTWNAYSLINYPDIVVGMLTIGLLGTLSTALVRWMMRPFVRWQSRSRT
jgi:NitT/TauT family transport system permease protein